MSRAWQEHPAKIHQSTGQRVAHRPSINAGNWPPIPYQPQQVVQALHNRRNNRDPATSSNAQDVILNQPGLAMFSSQQLVDRLFQSTGPSSQPGSPKRTNGIVCRGVGGQTSTHQPTDVRKGNKRCLYRSCASCCQTFGDKAVSCPAKGHVIKHNQPAPQSSTSATRNIHPVLACLEQESSGEDTPLAPPASSAPLPTHKRLPRMSAQSGARIAKEMDHAQLARLFDLRKERTEAMKRDQRLDVDESKVVKIIAWLKSGEPPKMFSFIASKWPKFTLDQCQHLVNDAAVIEGLSDADGWSQALSLWDPSLDGWVLVKGSQITEENCPRFKYYLGSTYDTAIEAPLAPETSSGLKIGQPNSSTAEDDDNDEIIVIREVRPIPTTSQPKLTAPNQEPTGTGHESDASVEVVSVAKMKWPDDDGPMSELMDWFTLMATMPRLRAWDEVFKSRFNRGDRTAYRYAQWLHIIGEVRLQAWEKQQIEMSNPVTVAALRQQFLTEYVQAGCPPPVPKPENPSVQGGQKRKLGWAPLPHYTTDIILATYTMEHVNPVADSGVPPPNTLHALCGFDQSRLFTLTQSLDTHQLGRRGLPVYVPDHPSIHNNASVLAICPDPTNLDNDVGWRFVSQSAHVAITPEFVHRWDLRSTYQGTLSRGDLSSPLGVRIFDHNQTPLRDYLNIAQMNFHVAVSLDGFLKDLHARVEPGNFTAEEWEAISLLRVQENVVVHMHKAFPSPYGSVFIAGLQGVGPVITESVVHDVTRGNWIHSNHGPGAFCFLAELPDLPVAPPLSATGAESWATSITGWEVWVPTDEDREGSVEDSVEGSL
ncbi:uncharacterized protein MELLADRAFT_101883 [Melampsora larici-populina 98AG31]|uniref:Uncharacterized protein n=1 Tax=Melampsora larici-populina (strain 98AG31 / pathotype 3-4-7) TaxID=747676 RepID=F4R584_MELLP|nr:uncharacterized protein MELLADRAFT_101883 [Melampsora larici-populina 98AG31]EGG12003.1 hypothetical protein MELLADRAFT_101883 [Melampsora larici-populina 98AG31]